MQKGEIIKIEQQGPNTRRFWLKVLGEEVFEFRAGQFITMDLPIHERRRKRLRSYSIANQPGKDNVLEFTITHMDGLGTNYLFNEVKVGTEIEFKGPGGVFTLPSEVKNDLVFICTGTGVAPFRSMILDLLENKKKHQKIHVIFGTRHASGMLYSNEFEKLQQENTQFKYSVALSREEELPDVSFEVQKGYVHEVYRKHFQGRVEGKKFYLCGWTNMVDQASAILKDEMNCEDSQVIYELYG
jgi:CDP-4-dehydro-6-deoxyglucose reductase